MLDFTVYKGSPDGGVVEGITQKPEPTGDQVFLEITHSGVCGTDMHFKGFDMVLGHEGVGVVRGVGPEVKTLKV